MSDLFEHKQPLLFTGIYRALVLDNQDPEKLGRIKARVYPMFFELESDVIPWCVPASPLFSGAGSGSGAFTIPSVGSYVFVFFEAGKLEQPVYFAEAQTATMGIPTESATNYPNRRVLKTPDGFYIYIDETSNELKIHHQSGTEITIDNTGKVLINSSNIQLGTSANPLDITALVKPTDFGLPGVGKISAMAGSNPVVFTVLPAAGTTKVKGV